MSNLATGTSTQEELILNSSFYQGGVIISNTTAVTGTEDEDQDSASCMNVLTSGGKAILILELWLNKCVIIFYLMKWFQQGRVRAPCT